MAVRGTLEGSGPSKIERYILVAKTSIATALTDSQGMMRVHGGNRRWWDFRRHDMGRLFIPPLR